MKSIKVILSVLFLTVFSSNCQEEVAGIDMLRYDPTTQAFRHSPIQLFCENSPTNQDCQTLSRFLIDAISYYQQRYDIRKRYGIDSLEQALKNADNEDAKIALSEKLEGLQKEHLVLARGFTDSLDPQRYEELKRVKIALLKNIPCYLVDEESNAIDVYLLNKKS